MSGADGPASRCSALDSLAADKARYKQSAWLGRAWWISERSFWAVVVLRLGQRMLEIRNPMVRQLLSVPYGILHTFVQILTGVEIPPNVTIGPGIRIHHGMGIVVNAGSVIGRDVVLRQGVTIGARTSGGTQFPVVGDSVEFGAYAQVFGGVVIGDGARIGAMSVVLDDVPAGATVIGAPARVVQSKG